MENKENVYMENAQTGTVEGALSSAGSESAVKGVSTVLGKFKDVDALAKAYSSLQAEFTRRSQRLKELERMESVWNAEKGDEKSRGEKTALVVEKLRKNAVSVREAGKQFSTFVAELEKVGAQPSEDTELPAEAQVHGENVETEMEAEIAMSAEPKESSFTANHREAVALSADELFSQVNHNEQVRLKIIGEYLSSLKKSGAPLMTGGAGALATPPLKAKSVKEAGDMALRFFQNGTRAN